MKQRTTAVPGIAGPAFQDFYRSYLSDHARPATRLWHVAGTLALLAALLLAGLSLAMPGLPLGLWWVPVGVAAAYGLAWSSHLLIERNRPRTFRQPLYSVAGDFLMTFEILTRRRPLREPTAAPRRAA